MSMKRDVEFLYEVGAFRFVSRTWRQFLNADFANNAEHSFRVAWIALMLANLEGVKDHEKVLKMALVHDIPESRTGDVNYLTRQYTERKNDKAIHDVFIDTELGPEMVRLLEEYEERHSIESKIVKDADNLDVDFELFEQAARGETHQLNYLAGRELVYKTQLFTASAKRLWESIQGTNPHDWHLNAPNRLRAGDWAKAKRELDKAEAASKILSSSRQRSGRVPRSSRPK
jgi:putative hydrolase of HD superfamily